MIRRRSGVLALVLLLLVAVALAARALLAGSPGSETITVRVSEGTALSLDVSRDGRTVVFDLLGQLWLVPASGGAARALTDAVADTADDQDPSLSPDGKRIAFSAERGGRRGLWLLEIGAAKPVQLYQLPDPESFAGDAAWSPDGTRLAFARDRRIDSAGRRRAVGIALLDLASREVRDLVIEGTGEAVLRSPSWSVKGDSLLFFGFGRGGNRVWMVGAGGGVARAVTPAGPRLAAPVLAPDGRRFAYLAPDSAGAVQIWVQDLTGDTTSGAPARPVTRYADVAPTRVRWSADGRSLYFSADGRLRKIPAGGGDPAEIPFSAQLAVTRERPALPPARFPEPGVEQAARGFTGLALSPDGQRIGIIALGKLWIVPVGGEARAIADLPRTARYLAWSPDGGEVAWAAGTMQQQDLFATEVASGATRQVTALKGNEMYPAFSPDGRWLGFTHSDSTTRLRVVPARGETIRDAGAARDLGPGDPEWSGTDVSAPQWSPESDALLRMTQDQEGGAAGELVRLSGERVPVTMPDGPNHFRWIPAGLLWARHDRLWIAPFGRSGLTGPASPLGDAAAMYPSTARDGTVLFVSEGGLRLRAPSGEERSLGWPIRYTPPVAEPVLIRGVRIIDGTGAPATSPRDILIERGRLAQIAPAGSIAAANRRVVDATGRFAVPGLMDLHAHTYMPELLPGFLYFGVTLVSDQGSPMAPLVAWADAIAAGGVPGPRVSYGGFQYYSDWAFDEEQGRGVEPEADPAHVTRSVALAQAFGAHHIKTRTFRRWDINGRMIAEAHRRGMRVAGHCTQQLPLVAAGIDVKEHVGYCGQRYGSAALYGDVRELLRAAGIGVVPTISYTALPGYLHQRPELLDDPERAPLMAAKSDFQWMLAMNPIQRAGWNRDAEHTRETVAALARAGVTIGTGTDIWQLPDGVHLELQELVKAGLSPMDAIRAATGNSARIAGVDRDLGTIEVGKLADLVLLEADPLADISNTRRIWTVIKGGMVVDRAALRETYRLR